MKKIISLILSVVLCISLMMSVNAQAPSATVTATYNGVLDAMVVSGTLASDRGNVTLILEVSKDGGTPIFVDQLTVAYDSEANGVYEYSFTPVKFALDLPSGNYDVKVSGRYLSQAVSTTYDHSGPDLLHSALKEINTTIDNEGDFSALSETTYTRLGVNYSLFDNLGTEGDKNGKKSFATIMYTKDYPIPDTYNVADVPAIKEQVALFAADYNEACLVSGLYDVAEASNIWAWINNNKSNFNTDDAATTNVDESELFKYVEKVYKESLFTDRFTARLQFYNVATLKSAMYEDALLALIEGRHYSEVTEVLQKFSSLFGIDESNIDSDILAKVYENMPGAYDNYAAVGTRFNELVNSYLNGGGGGTTIGGGSSFGGGGSGGASIVTRDENTSFENADRPEFTDIGNVSWAVEAINYLADKGIVAGKTATEFAPNDLVKRSEFIKLVVAAFNNNEIAGSECTFTDIESNAWYAPYVATAQKKNLVFGDELNRFRPDAYITRQDMAVILYRAYVFYGDTNISLKYKDKAKISEYAREAVAVLSSEGIINGTGDNKFDPLSNATRAQAAQMIYKMMMK